MTMPIESIYVNVKEKIITAEGGYDEMPYAVARWMKSSSEKYGRGQGTAVLSAVKELQQMHKDFVECGNKWNNPPLEVLDTFEGQVRVTPGAENYVRELNSIKAIQRDAMGNFPITKDMLEFQQDIIHKAFFKDIFVQLGQLKGDRRTTVEIDARIKEGLRRLVSPVSRMEHELFTPNITRSVLLLIRNGRIPYPPAELQGESFGIEYVGELALALRDYQARAFMQYAAFIAEMETVFPGVKDNINSDKAARRMGRAFGVNEEDLATEEERDASRQERLQKEQAMMQLEMAGAAAEGYQKTSKKAEEGSPASEAQEAVAG
jgi:hypothetical protein